MKEHERGDISDIVHAEGVSPPVGLREVYAKYFLFGNILSPPDLDCADILVDFRHHYNALTAENAMKPMYITSARGEYDFSQVDKLVGWANASGIKMVGHTFIWHSQSAAWLNKNADGSPVTRAEARANMEAFIKTYASKYSGKIHSWDVLNEAMRDADEFTGNWRTHLRHAETDTYPAFWYLAYANGASEKECGSDYIFDAFYFARKYDPAAILYYNDYNDEVPAKREAIAQMVEEMNARWQAHPEYDGRLLIEGIGMQAHYNEGTDLNNVRESLTRFIQTGAKISVTELDITFGTGEDPAVPLLAEQSRRQAEMYAELFDMYVEFSAHIERVSMWARHDGNSWRSWGSPVLFDGSGQPKEAFKAVCRVR